MKQFLRPRGGIGIRVAFRTLSRKGQRFESSRGHKVNGHAQRATKKLKK